MIMITVGPKQLIFEDGKPVNEFRSIVKTYNIMDKIKKTRTPKNAENLMRGCLSLSLEDKVKLVKTLKDAIEKEVADAKHDADSKATIANGLG